MIDILHSFSVGIAFAVGVSIGAILCQLASRTQRKQFADDWRETQDRIEARLTGSLLCHERIAAALELCIKRESDGENAPDQP